MLEIESKFSECAKPDLGTFLHTFFVEPLGHIAELLNVIDDSVTRVVDEPSCTAFVNERFGFGYSPKPNRAVVSLVP